MPVNKDVPKLIESLRLFKRLFILIKPYWGKLLKGMSLGIIIGIIGVITPYLTKLLIDKVYPSQDISLMQVLVGGVLTLSVASIFIGAMQGYFNLYVNSKLSNSASLLFFDHLQHLHIRFFDEHRVGEIMSRFTDVNASLTSINKVFQTIFVNFVYLALVPPFLFMLQWKLAIIALISLPITFSIIAITGKYLRKYWKKSAEAYANLNAYQFEMLTNIRSLKAMVLEPHVYDENKKQMENALAVQLKAGGMGQVLGFSYGILFALNTALFTWIGWTFILTHQMTLGDYMAFTAYIGFLHNPLSQFVGLFSDFQQSAINLGRMFEYLDYPVEIEPCYSTNKTKKIIIPLSGEIEIKNLTFGYNKDTNVLEDINLKIDPKSVISIIGPSGSGKTSLIRLLIGMETPYSGEIFFDGKSMSQIELSQLRKQVTVTWQEFSTFSGSILDNLTIGLNNISEEKVKRAVKLSRMNELINSLPQGLDTPIAEWGASLSGGQRQRLAIARAVIRNTPIIIFDEATSNIDMKTEYEILRDLFLEEKDKTLIFITHRLATASIADKICLIDGGKILGYGTHSELLDESENYRRMYSSDSSRSNVVLKVVN
jgi:ABC-type bacteriocin/lantibiotic exporter with double-glycine peptidase domain